MISGAAEEEERRRRSGRHGVSLAALSLSQVTVPPQGHAGAAPSWWQREQVSSTALQAVVAATSRFEFGRLRVAEALLAQTLTTVTPSVPVRSEESPQWLKELKSKKRLSQYDGES